MSKKLLIIGFFLAPVVLMTAQDNLQFILDAHVKKWENSAQFTLECMRLMPSDAYDFQPTEDEMSFKKLCIHTIQNMVWLSTDYLEGSGFNNPTKDIDPSKEDLIKLMESAIQYSKEALEQTKPHLWKTRVDFFAGEMPLIKVIHLLHDHMTHHRGQMSVYLRLNQIKPPKYVGW